MAEFEHDPTFRIDNVHDLTRPQIREQIMTRLRAMANFVNTEPTSVFTTRLNTLILVDPGFTTRMAVHV
jgi:acyl-CoA oxidase